MASDSRPQSDDGLIAGINVTPFVDIALVLLIIFMVTAKVVASQPAIPIDLPREAHPAAAPVVDATVQIAIDAAGAVTVDARPATDAALRAVMAARRAQNPDVRAVIAADRAVPHGRVVRVIDAVREAGVNRFAIQTELPAPASPR